MKRDRWSALVVGIAGSVCLMLGVNRLPGLIRPEIGENRRLTEMPAIPRSMSALRSYPKRMDAYVADNFPARPHFIAALNYLRYKAGYSGTATVFVGKSGWLFYDDGGHLDQARNAMPLTATERRAWVSTLAARAEQLRSKNEVYIVLSAPVKELIFPDKLPRWARVGHGDAEVLEADARKLSQPNLVALRSALVRERLLHSDIYTPYDTHWTGYGARVAYRALCSKLNELGFAMEPLPLNNFSLSNSRACDLAQMLGISSLIRPYSPRLQHPIQVKLKTTYLSDKADPTRPRVVDTGLADKPTIQLTIDSFGEELLNFLYPQFSRLILSHPKDGFYREDLISTYRPNIVVLEVIESGLRFGMSPASEPEPVVRDRIREYFREQ